MLAKFANCLTVHSLECLLQREKIRTTLENVEVQSETMSEVERNLW